MEYKQRIQGDIVKIEIKDSSFKPIYKAKFKCDDKETWKTIMKIAEKYGFDVYSIIKSNWV